MDDAVTRLNAEYILAWDGEQHIFLQDSSVVWQHGRIIHVGRGWEGHVDEELEAPDSLVMPGLIDLDALTDIDHCLLDSWQDPADSGGYLWSHQYARAPEHVLSHTERLRMREFALAQLARHGVTTFMPIASEVHSEWAESYEDFVGISEVSRRIGLRGYMGPAYRYSVPVFDHDGKSLLADNDRGDAGLADARRFLEYADSLNDDLVHGVLLPCRIETQTFESLVATSKLAEEFDVHVRLHCLQSPWEEVVLNESWGMGVVDALEASGLLERSLMIPHGHELGDLRKPEVAGGRDVRRLVEAGVPIIYCPLTSARYGHLLTSFEAFREAGFTLVLGTDSFPPDLIRGIDVGVQLSKIAGKSLGQGRVDHFINAATYHAADALGRPDLGRISVGASADLIVADLSDFAMGAIEDPIRSLVVNGSGRDIKRTIVAGRTIMEDGAVAGVKDMESLSRDAQAIFNEIKSAYPSRDFLDRSTDELFPPSFSWAAGRR